MSDTNDMRKQYDDWAVSVLSCSRPTSNYGWELWQAATAIKDAEIAALGQKISENELMAECTVMLRNDLIEAGIVDYFVPPMMLTEAILGYISKLRQGGAV